MSYRLFYTARAERDIANLDALIKDLRQALERYAQDPFRYARKMVSPELGLHRFRVGDWRVICDSYEDCIVVLRVGHRREIYRG